MRDYYLNQIDFDDGFTHALLLADLTRVHAFLRAIDACVKPGMRVVELGAGLGVFGRYAASLGAEVTLIDCGSRVTEYSRTLTWLQGPTSNVTTIEADISEVILPPQDVVIHEMIGARLYDEGIQSTLAKFQKNNPWSSGKGVQYLPDRVELWAAFGSCPDSLGQIGWIAHSDEFHYSSTWHLVSSLSFSEVNLWPTHTNLVFLNLDGNADALIWGMRLSFIHSVSIDTRHKIGQATSWGSPVEKIAKQYPGRFEVMLSMPVGSANTSLFWKAIHQTNT